MSETGSIKYLKAWTSGLLIGLMGIGPTFAAYNVTAIDAISKVEISGKTEMTSGLIAEFVINSGTVSGTVSCGAGNLRPDEAYHYTLIDLPREGNSTERYRINENLSLSATAANGSLGHWKKEYAGVCSNYGGGIAPPTESTTNMRAAFPVTLSFYVKRRPIDNLITFPHMPLGGYIRAFGGELGLGGKVYAIPIVLMGGAIQLPSTCSASPVELTLDHGVVSAGSNFHSTSSAITYTCDSPVKATLSLSYEADGDGTLPLKETTGKTGAVSKLTITDPETGASGRSIKASINASKTFMVSSELSKITGNGQLKGSAWLIAVQD